MISPTVYRYEVTFATELTAVVYDDLSDATFARVTYDYASCGFRHRSRYCKQLAEQQERRARFCVRDAKKGHREESPVHAQRVSQTRDPLSVL